MSAPAHSGPEQPPPSAPGLPPYSEPDPNAPVPPDPERPLFPEPQPEPEPVAPPPVEPIPVDNDDDELILYDYASPPFQIRERAIKAAEAELGLLLEDADEDGEDMLGSPFCGCDTCVARLAAAFWISWTLEALRSGDLTVIAQPAFADSAE